MRHYILQAKEQDCGFTLVKILLASYQKSDEYLYLPCPKEEAFQMLELKTIAKENGLALEGRKLTDMAEWKQIPKDSICHMQFQKTSHYVLLEKTRKNHVVIFDPAVGKMSLPKEEFLTHFTGYFLTPTSLEKRGRRKEKQSIDGLEIADFSLQISSFLSLWGLLRFLDETPWKFLLFAILSCLSFFLLFLVKMVRMKKFDQKYPPKKENYIVQSEAKKILFTKYREWPYFAGLLLSELLFLLNDFSYALLLLLWTILGVLMALFQWQKTLYSHRLQRMEIDAESEQDFTRILKKVYRLEIHHYLIRFVLLIVLFLTLYFYMTSQNVLSFNSLIFHLFFAFYFVESLSGILSFEEKEMHRRTSLERFHEKFQVELFKEGKKSCKIKK